MNNFNDLTENVRHAMVQMLGQDGTEILVETNCPFCKNKVTVAPNREGHGKCPVCECEIILTLQMNE